MSEERSSPVAGRVFYRYMSRAEVEAVVRTGKLRGGRPGRTYWTTDLYGSPTEAKSRLALEYLPEARLEFRITSEPGLLLAGTRVEPDEDEPGGGTEYVSEESVEAEVVSVDYLE
ncbi:hypothetical protein GBA63_19635 [Rubrobacter tropicus]|uniref:Uncharacterized protein n=1 Tax=Rubrobacter tropicus TaxID=2653851 RepID=A0A6G8QDU2_9ACTN|nr:hypothetical protein [Rubrobacter tropicus]QIN84612.1 hypothetical protein GBA63_19635 [Rubrobacter tropicus]